MWLYYFLNDLDKCFLPRHYVHLFVKGNSGRKTRCVNVLQSPVLLFSAGVSTLCHSDDADSAAVMTFHYCHANFPRSLWPAVSLSPIINTTVWPPSCLLSVTHGDAKTSVASL